MRSIISLFLGAVALSGSFGIARQLLDSRAVSYEATYLRSGSRQLQNVFSEGLANLPPDFLQQLQTFFLALSEIFSSDFESPFETPTLDTPPSQPVSDGTIMGAIASFDELSILKSLIDVSPGIFEVLSAEDSLTTLFAPSNQAFQRIEDDFGIRVEDASPGALQFILQFHMFDGLIPLSSLVENTFLRATNGNATLVARSTNEFVLESPGNPRVSRFESSNIETDNGMIHIIDNVLLTAASSIPREIEANMELSIFHSALKNTGLIDILFDEGPFTVFAPTNDAFDALGPEEFEALFNEESNDLLKRILLYHISPEGFLGSGDFRGTIKTLLAGSDIKVTGLGTTLNGAATFTERNVQTTTGVLHKINFVLDPNNMP